MAAELDGPTVGELARLIQRETEQTRQDMERGFQRVEQRMSQFLLAAVYQAHHEALVQRVVELEDGARTAESERQEWGRVRLGVGAAIALGVLADVLTFVHR